MGIFRKIIDAVSPTQTPAYQRALASIAEAKANNKINLSLSNYGRTGKGERLTTIPPEILELKSLTYLDLKGNDLTDVPACIKDFKHLTTLNLENNSLPDT